MTSPKDWLDIVIAVGFVGLAIDRWVHGRETVEDRQSHKIRFHSQTLERLEREFKVEIDRLWKSIDEIHKKASDMSSDYQTKGGTLSITLEVVRAELKNVQTVVAGLSRRLERRSEPRDP